MLLLLMVLCVLMVAVMAGQGLGWGLGSPLPAASRWACPGTNLLQEPAQKNEAQTVCGLRWLQQWQADSHKGSELSWKLTHLGGVL
jgi:hypothetical protein